MKLFNGFKFFLNPLWVTETFLTTNLFGAIASGIGIVDSLFGGGDSQPSGNMAGGAYYDPYQKERRGFFNQMQNLIRDPSSISRMPGYKWGMQQGDEQLNRNAARTGQRFSGAHDITLSQFGQGYAKQWYDDSVNRLAGFANINQGPLNVTGQNQLNQQQSQYNQESLGGALSAFGGSDLGKQVGGWIKGLF